MLADGLKRFAQDALRLLATPHGENLLRNQGQSIKRLTFAHHGGFVVAVVEQRCASQGLRPETPASRNLTDGHPDVNDDSLISQSDFIPAEKRLLPAHPTFVHQYAVDTAQVLYCQAASRKAQHRMAPRSQRIIQHHMTTIVPPNDGFSRLQLDVMTAETNPTANLFFFSFLSQLSLRAVCGAFALKDSWRTAQRRAATCRSFRSRCKLRREQSLEPLHSIE